MPVDRAALARVMRATVTALCQALVAMRTSSHPVRQAGLGLLALILLGITLFAVPVG